MSEQILIRCVSIKNNQVRNLVPSIALNELRMKQIGFIIQDPKIQEKREQINYNTMQAKLTDPELIPANGQEEKKKCGCGKSKNMPYCDGSHSEIKNKSKKK